MSKVLWVMAAFYKRNLEESLQLVGYSDSDMAGDIDDRKSTTRVLFYLGNSPVSWGLSEAKNCGTFLLWSWIYSCNFSFLTGHLVGSSSWWDVEQEARKSGSEDRQPVSHLTLQEPCVFHERSKHTDTRYHFVHDCMEEEKISVKHVRTEDQLADILTKSLGRNKFLEMREKVGMQSVKQVPQG